MEGFALLSPCVICPCGKTYLEMPDEQREAYYAALKQMKENRLVQEEPLEKTSEHKQKTDE